MTSKTVLEKNRLMHPQRNPLETCGASKAHFFPAILSELAWSITINGIRCHSG